MPAVSVVCPTYNNADTIIETLQSVLSQSFEDFELICIDDGSVDNTVQQIETLADHRIRIVHGNHHGVSHARNVGIANATGEYIAFVDADDVWSRHKLAASLTALEQYPAVVAISSITRIQSDLDNDTSQPRVELLENCYEQILTNGGELWSTASTLVFRTSDLRKAGGFAENLEGAEDWHLMLRMCQSRCVVRINAPYVFYRSRPGQCSRNVEMMEQHSLMVANAYTVTVSSELKKQCISWVYSYLRTQARSNLEYSPISQKTVIESCRVILRSLPYARLPLHTKLWWLVSCLFLLTLESVHMHWLTEALLVWRTKTSLTL